MMVRDEADIIEASVRHLAAHVDRVYVADNLSTDGTYEILEALAADEALNVVLSRDTEVGYYQSRKMSAMAHRAAEHGYRWVVPCDADELWYGPEDTPVREYLEMQPPDVQIVLAALYDYLPTLGRDEGHPFERIVWRKAVPGVLPKVACRSQGVRIEPGNHSARYGSSRTLKVGGLMIRHFTWRSPEQYLRKIRNGLEAYGATNVPETFGAHWRMFEGASDETIIEHYHRWFVTSSPNEDGLMYDPAVVWPPVPVVIA